MKRITLIIGLIVLLAIVSLADTETPVLNFTTSAGAVDDKTKVWRDDDGIMYFLDTDNTTKTLSDLVTEGETDHGKLTGLADDDHIAYHTDARHTEQHTDAYNMALLIDMTEEVKGNTTLGGHLGDEDIHWLREGQKIYVAKIGGQYATIQGAIDSISDASAAKPYVIYVAPGIYTGRVILSKSYISIVGIQPQGAKLIEAQNSGVVITYESTGVDDDLMTLWLKSGGATDLKGITIANLTIINTQTTGYGSMQAAVNIGRGDPYPRAHEIVFENCNLYGEDKVVFVETGNPIFIDCYIEGESSVITLEDDAGFKQCRIKTHNSTIERLISIGKTGDIAFTAEFIACVFEADYECLVGEWTANDTTTRFFHCVVPPDQESWDSGVFTGTINLWATNGYGWPSSGVTYYRQPKLDVGNETGGTFYVEAGLIAGGDADMKWNLGDPEQDYSMISGFGTAGPQREMISDLDQTDHSFVRRVKGENSTGQYSSRGSLMTIEHEVDTAADENNDAVLLTLKNTKGDSGFDLGATGNPIEYYLDDALKFVMNKDGDFRTSGSITSSADNVVVVDKGGGGDYTTIQAAINSIDDATSINPYVVYVLPGVYNEYVQIVDKDYVAVVGIDRQKVVIEYERTDATWAFQMRCNEAESMSHLTLANLTIKNTNEWGGGGQDAQAALNIGAGNVDEPPVTDVRITNCSLYGYQDTIFVYPNAEVVFENCYIYGGFDIGSHWNSTAKYFNCRLEIDHTEAAGIFYQDESTVHIIDCWLESADSGSRAVRLLDDTDVLYFIGNYLGANVADNPLRPDAEKTPTMYVTGNNGYNYNSGITTLKIPYLDVDGDVDVSKGLNVGTATGAGTGDGKFSGDLTIGGNEITFGNGEKIDNLTDGYVKITGKTELGTASIICPGTLSIRNAADDGYENIKANYLTLAGNVIYNAANEATITLDNDQGITVPDKIAGKRIDIADYTGGKPAAAVAYRGQMVLEEGGEEEQDRLWICLKGFDGGYDWIEIAVGEPEP